MFSGQHMGVMVNDVAGFTNGSVILLDRLRMGGCLLPQLVGRFLR